MSFLSKILDSLKEIAWPYKLLGGTLVTGSIVYVILKKKGAFNPSKPPKVKVNYPRDTVILHNYCRGPYAPSLVPFAVKLETFLRMTNVPYLHVAGEEPSPKGKFPWIEYNDEVVADSAFCIKFINKTFNQNIDARFTEAELGSAHAMRKMMEENTYWTFVLTRWMYDEKKTMYHLAKLPLNLVPEFHKMIKDATHKHGIGRHTEEEMYTIMRDDLGALSAFLGKKKYLLGDFPCEDDFAVFGQLSQFYWHCVGNKAEKTVKEFQNLCDYCERMKDEYWPDWDQCNTNGGTKEAEK